MTRIYMIACCGMVCVFNVTFAAQRIFAGEATPVFADASDWMSVENVMSIVREFGLPTFFSLVFGMSCAFMAKLMYRDNRRQLQEKDAVIAIKDVVIAKRDATIDDMRRQLDEAHAREKVYVEKIARLEGLLEGHKNTGGHDGKS